jgi:glycosyltransferase involved in cell wall biosynthesis
MKKINLVFYFPYRGIGGVSALFLRLSEALKKDFNIYLADFSDGYMSKNKPEDVRIIQIDKNPVFPGNSVFIFQSFLPWRFPFVELVPPDSRVIFWGLHPQNFYPGILNELHRKKIIFLGAKIVNSLSNVRRNKIIKFIKFLQAKNSIVFMGRENVQATEKNLNYNIENYKIIPVPVPDINKTKKFPASFNKIYCGWVGRICDFKYQILEHTMVRLADASLAVGPIKFLIIGDGEFRTYLEQVSVELQTDRYEIEFIGEVSSKDLTAYLLNNIDILFSMGTSALEGARLGIPVFLTDYSYRKIIKKYRYKYFYQNPDNSLGEEINDSHYEEQSTLETSLMNIVKDYKTHSTLCKNYWKKNFSLEASILKLNEAINESEATFGQMSDSGYFKSDIWGKFIRKSMLLMRKDLKSEDVGFRHDC